jgi:hypothetical protein
MSEGRKNDFGPAAIILALGVVIALMIFAAGFHH